jgi:hypothetical protein
MSIESDETLEAAERAGAEYAQEQISGDYFQDWVREQLAEGEQLRREDPDKFIAIDSPRGAREVAKNLLQQLAWDTKRELDPSIILELSGAEGLTQSEIVRAFYVGFDGVMRSTETRRWLADIVLDVGREIEGGREVGETRAGTHQDSGTMKEVDRKTIKHGEWIEVYDPSHRVSYGMGGRGVYKVERVGRVNVIASTDVRFSPTGPWYHQEHKIPLSHVVRVVPANEIDRPHTASQSVSESTRSRSAPTEQQLVDYFLFDAEDQDIGTFSRAKTNEVASHFGITPEAAFRALDALARRGTLTKTRDVMKRHRGKTAVGYQWWEYGWKPGDLARYEARGKTTVGEARRRPVPSVPGAASGLEWHRHKDGFYGLVDGAKRFLLDPSADGDWILWAVNPKTCFQTHKIGRYPTAADAKDAARVSLSRISERRRSAPRR